MKNALLVVSTGVGGKINIGDYIQAVAASQFLPSVDAFIERETELSEYEGEKIRMIMNGWYMNHPENWPPSPLIRPLFVALHINKCGLPAFLSTDSVNYLKTHEPIGCRDTNTVRLLQERGVDAYFSGCLTLTLGYKYKSKSRGRKVYVVEPYTCNAGLVQHHKWQAFLTLCFLATHYRKARMISRKKEEQGFRSLFYNAFFLKEYSRVFDEDMLLEAEYVNQYNEEIDRLYPTQEEKLEYAKTLIQGYAEAACVITSRIHCALPCLGLETPVVFVQYANDNPYSTDRFGGLLDLMHVATWDGLRLRFNSSKSKIGIDNFPKNKKGWEALACSLINKCKQFVKND